MSSPEPNSSFSNDSSNLLAVELRIKPLPKLRADGVAPGRVEGDVLPALVDERAGRAGEEPAVA
eukprot:5602405-Pleurochrysis_carterae.AAC.1